MERKGYTVIVTEQFGDSFIQELKQTGYVAVHGTINGVVIIYPSRAKAKNAAKALSKYGAKVYRDVFYNDEALTEVAQREILNKNMRELADIYQRTIGDSEERRLHDENSELRKENYRLKNEMYSLNKQVEYLEGTRKTHIERWKQSDAKKDERIAFLEKQVLALEHHIAELEKELANGV